MYGPFQILEKLSATMYSLKLPSYVIIHNSFSVDQFEFFGHAADVESPPTIVYPEWDVEEEFDIEAILEHSVENREYSFLIKWLGYPLSSASWVSPFQLMYTLDGEYCENTILDAYCVQHGLPVGPSLCEGVL